MANSGIVVINAAYNTATVNLSVDQSHLSVVKAWVGLTAEKLSAPYVFAHGTRCYVIAVC